MKHFSLVKTTKIKNRNLYSGFFCIKKPADDPVLESNLPAKRKMTGNVPGI